MTATALTTPPTPPPRRMGLGIALLIVAGVMAVVSIVWTDTSDRAQVRTAPVIKRELTSKVMAQGRVRAREQVEVASEIGGRIKAVLVKAGDVVKAGDTLFTLDDEQLKNTVEQLRVALSGTQAMSKRALLAVAEAERAAERDSKLKERGVLADDALRLTQSRLELARADVEQATASAQRTQLDLTRAKDTVKRAQVNAPIAGTVVAVGVEVGQVVSAVSGISASGDLPGMGFGGGTSAPVVIADLSELIVKLEVDELDVGDVKVGQHARVTAQGIKQWEFAGPVERVGLMGREQSGAVLFAVEVGVQTVEHAKSKRTSATATTAEQADVALPLPRDVLRPGMSAQADIEVEKLTEALTIPVAAVLEGALDEEGNSKPDHVFVVEGNIVKQREVKLGPSEDDRIAVLSGLTLEDVVVEGPFRVLKNLEDGQVISIDNSAKSSKSSDKGSGAKP